MYISLFLIKTVGCYNKDTMNIRERTDMWDTFKNINHFRRAIRKFGTTPIPEEDVREVLAEATLAPSSGNMHPYELHWVHDPDLKRQVAEACNGQKAAATAADLIVIVASPSIAKRTTKLWSTYLEHTSTLSEDSKVYHRKQLKTFQRVITVGSLALWSPFVFMSALIRPTLSLLPIGYIGSRQWDARSAIFAAQTILLAAAAKGIDSCPMEGFSASKIASTLKLPRGSVVPIVIALGYRADDARIEERWRRPIEDIVVSH